MAAGYPETIEDLHPMSTRPKTVALLGGSFNPPHVGHLIAVTYVKATQPVDEIWLLPTYHHPFGKELDEIERRAPLIVLQRPGHPSPRAIGPPLINVSSTEARQALERGETPSLLVPRAVLDYARAHHLYGL